MIFKKKQNSEFNKQYVSCGLSLFFVVVIVFVKFGQSALYEINTFLESLNIRFSPKGLFESIVPMNMIFDMSQYLGIIVFVLKIIFVVVCTLPIFIFVSSDEVDKISEQKITIVKKIIDVKMSSYKVNERFLCWDFK